MDAIPHLEMWKDLPFLVRDGALASSGAAAAAPPRDGATLARAALFALRTFSGIFFSIDTIKSKGKAQYQTYL